MNRAQRRAQAKIKKFEKARDSLPPSKAGRLAAFMQQGISPEDLEKEFNRGFNAGFRAAAEPTVRCMFAAILLAAHDCYGFGQKRGIRLLNKVDQCLVETLTSAELADQVFDKLGVRIDWSEPVERARAK